MADYKKPLPQPTPETQEFWDGCKRGELRIQRSKQSGEAYFPWIALDDVLYAVLYLLSDSSLTGPLNLGAPNPTTQQVFADTLGHIVRRPTPWRIPTGLVRHVSGEAADEMMLKSIRMHPEALLSSGFRFAYPDLETALRHLLGRFRPTISA